MAKRRKGVVPPQLRPYLFKKGGGRARRAVRVTVSRARAAGRSVARAMARRRTPSGGLSSDLKQARPIEMALMAALGYLIGPAINKSGLSYAAYNAVPQYKTFVDTMYASASSTGVSATDNPWSVGGGSGVMKLIGGALAAKTSYDVMKSGRMSGSALNARFPFAIGAILDPPQGASLGAGAGMTPSGSSANWA